MTVSWKGKVEKSNRRLEMDRLSEGCKRAIDKSRGPIAKNGCLGRNPSFWAQKKDSLLDSNHVLATAKQSCEKNGFLAKKHSSTKRKNDGFSLIPEGTRSVVIVGHFFDGPTVPPSFVDQN